jgi:hypothetical protein
MRVPVNKRQGENQIDRDREREGGRKKEHHKVNKNNKERERVKDLT